MVALAPVAEALAAEALVAKERVEADRRQTSLRHQSPGSEDLESLATEACSAAPLAAFVACLVEVDQAAAREGQEAY